MISYNIFSSRAKMTNHHDMKEISCGQAGRVYLKFAWKRRWLTSTSDRFWGLQHQVWLVTKGYAAYSLFPCQAFFFLSLLLFLSCPHMRMPRCKTHTQKVMEWLSLASAALYWKALGSTTIDFMSMIRLYYPTINVFSSSLSFLLSWLFVFYSPARHEGDLDPR